MFDDKLIDWKATDIMSYMWDGSPIYSNMKFCEKKYIKKTVECWLPIVITLKP